MTAISNVGPAWYFEQLSDDEFSPTSYVGGAWNPAEQHIAPVLGLLTHLIEQDCANRGRDNLLISRLSFEILGPLRMAPFRVSVAVIRPGKTIELVEARITAAERTAVVLRAWLLVGGDTAAISGSPIIAMPDPDTLPKWEYSSVWRGEFVRTVQARRAEQSPGRCTIWVRTDIDLLKNTSVSSTARFMGLIDVANGATPRASPDAVAFPNLDLTAHLIRAPIGSWVGLDTTVSFGSTGVGLTHSLIHDERGPVGVVSQCLTVRPAGNT
ncbi:thioesterase family protein [Steroidobacter cummioxidans]|uniref:thioesterase family protein n=1 Tax=Steroidobacter cummioxidans TaxID=1803913 RepID=UPI000E3201B1|nr:thioesterase family protein [Steroidobacter cummioxidans]